MRALAVAQILFTVLLLIGLFSNPSSGSMLFFAILAAGGTVIFQELRALENRRAGFQRYRPGGSPPPRHSASRPEALAIELDENDSVAEIARAMVATGFRQASMKYHPDRGGSDGLMTRIVEARALLLNSLNRY